MKTKNQSGHSPHGQASLPNGLGDTIERVNETEELRKEVQRAKLLLDLYEKAPTLSDAQLYQYTLDHAVQLTDSAIGFFHLVSDDQKMIILTTWNSEALKSCTAAEETHYPIEKAGNWVDCVRLKRPVIYNDFTQSPNQKGLPEGHTPVHRFMSIPVLEGDKIRIIFGVGNKKNEYDDHDVVHIQRIANELQKILEHKRMETDRIRVNRALLMLSATNQALIHITNEATLLNEVCRIAVDIGGYRLAWVGFAEHDEARTLRPIAFAGYDSGYLEAAAVSWADNERGRGPGGTAIRTGRPCISRNIPSDPAFAVWREAAVERGYKSIISLPLISEGQTLGALGIYAGEPDAFDIHEVEILKELSGDLAFGITALRTHVKQDQAEEALKDQYSTLRSIIDSTTAAVFSVDRQYLYTSYNKKHAATMKSLYGADIEIRHSLFEYMTVAEDREKARQNIDRALAGERHIETAYSGEEKLQRLIFEVSHSPVYTEDGGVIGVVVLAQDITDRKRAEEALRQSEERYRLIAENTADTITVFDLYLKPIYISPSVVKLRGYTVQEALGQSLDQMITPDARQIVNKAFADHMSLEMSGATDPSRAVLLELEEYRKDGSTIWVELAASFLRDEKLAPTGILTVTRDITARKKAEEELKRLTHAIEQSPVSVIITDAAGEIEYVNPKFTQVTGYAKDEVTGKNPRFLKSGETGSGKYQQLWGAITAGKDWRGEFHNKKKNGELFWEAASISPVRDERGAITHYIAIKEDITERKRSEEELRDNEAKRLQLERELIQSQKFESLGTLASGIAHDFNNILGIIIGYSELLGRSFSEPEKIAQSLNAIQKASLRGASLVKQLLTFAHKGESVFVPVSINQIAAEIIKLLQETLPKTITVSTVLESEVPFIIADTTQIHQVLLNLCINARDAMPTGGSLTISTAEVDNDAVVSQFPGAAARGYVLVKVTDTGMGMNEETKQRIFDPFFTTKGPGKGTGLGLALVHSIVDNHRGMIAVESAPGRGTTFSLYFPIEERSIDMPRSPADQVADIPGGTETVLLIEDEEMLTEALKDILSAKGYDVLTARDGEQGFEIYRRHQTQIAVVLTDLGLPKYGGDEVFRRIKAIDPKARVILASGFVEPAAKSYMVKAGLTEFLQKPCSPADILRAVRSAIDMGK